MHCNFEPSKKLKLAKLHGQAEVFFSIQGEGKSIGLPSIFVRTSLCNLHCFWCDTDYTWNWVGTPFAHTNDAKPGYRKFEKRDWIAEETVEAVAEKVLQFDCRNVVLTGGEPMMQQAGLTFLMKFLKEKNAAFRFEVETNGTYLPKPAFDELVDQYNVSPKLDNSRNPQRLREKPAAYRFFTASPKANFKFVVAEPIDLEEVLLLRGRYGIPSEKIILMPEGNTREVLAERREWLVEVCKKHGFRFSDRLHVQIWGDKKGV